MQHKLKYMNFKAEKESWISHFYDTPLFQQYQTLVQSNYVRHQLLFPMDEYINNNNNKDTKLVCSKIKNPINQIQHLKNND